MNGRGQGGIVGAIMALLIVFLILDLFFLGIFLIDEPIFQVLENSLN